jgi:hypothetical protein
MTLLGPILCGESIAHISNPSLTLNQGIGVCVLKRKFLDFLRENDAWRSANCHLRTNDRKFDSRLRPIVFNYFAFLFKKKKVGIFS